MCSFLEAQVGFSSNYYEITDVTQKKEAFVQTLDPLIEVASQAIKKERGFATLYFTFEAAPWQAVLDGHLKPLAKKYRIKKLHNKEAYFERIDLVPKALVLAQAALESGWGSSRFVREANNIFGEWTWGKKGLVPQERDENKKHKIRIFATLQDSIHSYMLNLNRHFAYKAFRKARREASLAGKPFYAMTAAKHLHGYSEIGDTYKKLIRGVIEQNRWHDPQVLQEIVEKKPTL